MSDYTYSPTPAVRSRLFFALWPDEQTRRSLADAAERLLAPSGARRVASENLHLTLVFLGAVDEAMQACCERAADGVHAQRFSLEVDRAACWQRRGIAWAGPSRQSRELTALVAALNAALRPCGYEAEKRRFRAHITLARNAKHGHQVAIEAFRWNVDRFCLLASDLGTGGGVYRVLRTWDLK